MIGCFVWSTQSQKPWCCRSEAPELLLLGMWVCWGLAELGSSLPTGPRGLRPAHRGEPGPRSDPFASGTILPLRSTSAFDLMDGLERQLSQQLQSAEHVPATTVHETPDAYQVVLEPLAVDQAAIAVKATDRTP